MRKRLARAEDRYDVILPGDPRVTRGEGLAVGGYPSCRRRWYWIVGGVVAAALAAVIVVVATRGDDAPEVTLDPDDFIR